MEGIKPIVKGNVNTNINKYLMITSVINELIFYSSSKLKVESLNITHFKFKKIKKYRMLIKSIIKFTTCNVKKCKVVFG